MIYINVIKDILNQLMKRLSFYLLVVHMDFQTILRRI